MGDVIGAAVCLALCALGIIFGLWGAGIAVVGLFDTFRR